MPDSLSETQTDPWPKEVRVVKNRDGTVTTREWPPPGVKAIAELLRTQYLSEHETTAPLSDWLPVAMEIARAYDDAEGRNG